MPTPLPTPYPTVSPTPAPTCTPKTLDVCIAIDESGSICSLGGGQQLCLGHGPCTADLCDVDPSLPPSRPGFSNNCDYANNCRRFNDVDATPNVKNFTTTFISEVEKDLKTKDASNELKVSVVEFATQAFTTSGLVDSTTAINAVENIEYSGGATNLEQAILKCNATLNTSTADLTAIVLVSDGFPTIHGDPATGFPSGDNTGPAEVAADAAKAAGIQIATVYVLGGPSDGSEFLQEEIVSPGLNFTDLSFPDARELADSILDGIDPCLSD
jgi:hypothetical protein